MRKVGLYSFKTLEVSKIDRLKNKIDLIMGCRCEVYVYSENTYKERLSQREGLRKMLDDYRKSKIDTIVFEEREALGQDRYTTNQIIKILSEEKVNFKTIKDDYYSSQIYQNNIKYIEIYDKFAKQEADKRSRMGQKLKNIQMLSKRDYYKTLNKKKN